MESRDVRVAKWLQRKAGGATHFWRMCAKYGMGVYVLASLMFMACMPFIRVVGVFFFPVLSVFVATLWVQYVIHRTRPTVTRTDYHQWIAKYSFPSAHAATAHCFAVLLSAAVVQVVPAVAWLCIPCAFILALVIALSRVVVGVHHPSDVVAGAAFGSAIALLFVTL